MATFRERLDELVHARGVSYNKVALATGVSQQLLSYVSTGKRETVGVDKICKLAHFFGVSAQYLAGYEDEYGLWKDDWAQMGEIFRYTRELNKRYIKDVSDFTGIPYERIQKFENGSEPEIGGSSLLLLAGAIGQNPMTLFYPFSEAIWPQGTSASKHPELSRVALQVALTFEKLDPEMQRAVLRLLDVQEVR